MPNYCNFNLKAVGEKENLLKLVKYFKAEYDYSDDKCECSEDKHFYRIFEFDVDRAENQIENEFTAYGYCAWSVWSCIFKGDSTYYSRNEQDKDNKERKHTHILEAARELNLDIEIYSEESGMYFEEHYLIKNGELVESKCLDYEEEEILDEDGEEIGEYTKTGGFGEWSWAI